MTENHPSKEVKKTSKFLANRIFFLIHLFLFVGVNLLLILIWGLTGAGVFWPLASIFGWGIAMSLHTVVYLMLNDKVDVLTKVRQEGNTLRILFIYHLTVYASVMLLLIMVDIMKLPVTANFLYPLVIWGIIVTIHGLGFSNMDKQMEKQIKVIRGKNPEFSENKLKREAGTKIARTVIMLMHLGVYVVVNAFLYIFIFKNATPDNRLYLVSMSIGWGSIVAIHVLGFIFSYIVNMKRKWNTLIINFLVYVIATASTIIRNTAIDPLPYRYWQYPAVVGGIWIGVLLIMTFAWEFLMKNAVKRITKDGRNADLEEHDVNTKARRLVFWEGTFVAHIVIYVAGILLLNSPASNVYSIYGLGILFIPALGWLIGLAVHGVLVFIIWKPVKNNLNRSILIHIVVYIFTGILLVFLNLNLTPGFLWCLIALGGWGLGLGFHLLVKAFKKKQ